MAWDPEAAFYLPATPESWEIATHIIGKDGATKVSFDLKAQLAALLNCTSSCGASLPAIAVADGIVDVRISAWLVKPDDASVSDSPTFKPQVTAHFPGS